MTNANPIIVLRNSTLVWGTIMILTIVGSWGVLNFFKKNTSVATTQIATLSKTIKTLEEEGVVTEKNWTELSSEEQKSERWATMTKLVPTLQKLVGSGTAQAGKNIVTMKTISQKVGQGNYISWLEKSWTGSAQTELTETQENIAEVIPVFAGIAEVASTENIGGKITLKSLIEYVQSNIVDQYGLQNALGDIGIKTVQFLEKGDIGAYEVPVEFQGVPNEHVMNLLKFLGQTGGIKTVESGNNNITIEHLLSRPLRNAGTNESTLKNMLITIKDMTVTQTPEEELDNNELAVSSKNNTRWDVRMTLRFYIRGVSRDYIADLDTRILTLLDKNNRTGSLITRGNNLLKTCNNCPEASQIKDIIVLLTNARAAYDSIITQEKNPKNTFTSIEILAHRTDLLTAIETLEKKLNAFSSITTQR